MARSGRRPATETYDGSARVGVDLGGWRLDGRGDVYRGRDIMTPGDLCDRHQLPGPEEPRAIESGRRVSTAASARTRCPSRRTAPTTAATRPTSRPRTRSTGRSCRICRSRASSAGAALQVKDVVELVARQQPRLRLRLREGDERQPFVHAHRRSRGAVLGRQQQAHGRRLRREHAEALGRTHGRCRWADAFDHITTETVDTPLKTNFTPSESDVHRLQSERRHQARAREGPARALRRSGARSFRPKLDADRVSRRPSSADARRSTRAIPI